MIRKGVTTPLTADVRDEAGTAQTVTSGVITVTDGAETIVDAATVTPGTGATYGLNATVTTSRAYSDQLLERWTLLIAGTSYEFTRPAYLVRSLFTPVLTPTDLLTEYSDLDEIRSPDLTSWEAKVTDARERIERELIKSGRRPDMIFDSWAFFDAHRHLVCHLIFKDAKSSIGDGRYAELADWHHAEFLREMGSVQFRYDTAKAGEITSTSTDSAVNTVILSSGNPRGGYAVGTRRASYGMRR